MTRQAQPVLAREPDIEQDQRGRLMLELFARRRGTVDHDRLESLIRQVFIEHLPDPGVVVDHEHAIHI